MAAADARHGVCELLALQAKAAAMVMDRLYKGEPLRCIACDAPIVCVPNLIGWMRPLSGERIYAFVLCPWCGTDDADDFRTRFIAAIGGAGAHEIKAGKA